MTYVFIDFREKVPCVMILISCSLPWLCRLRYAGFVAPLSASATRHFLVAPRSASRQRRGGQARHGAWRAHRHGVTAASKNKNTDRLGIEAARSHAPRGGRGKDENVNMMSTWHHDVRSRAKFRSLWLQTYLTSFPSDFDSSVNQSAYTVCCKYCIHAMYTENGVP